jgi:mannose/fructose/N-acetylgalactosamine-specific phosphotransferase system component IIC
LALALVAARLAPAGAVAIGVVLAVLVYFYRSLRRLFGEGWFRTLWKSALLGTIHLVSIFAGFLLVVLASIIFL